MDPESSGIVVEEVIFCNENEENNSCLPMFTNNIIVKINLRKLRVLDLGFSLFSGESKKKKLNVTSPFFFRVDPDEDSPQACRSFSTNTPAAAATRIPLSSPLWRNDNIRDGILKPSNLFSFPPQSSANTITPCPYSHSKGSKPFTESPSKKFNSKTKEIHIPDGSENLDVLQVPNFVTNNSKFKRHSLTKIFSRSVEPLSRSLKQEVDSELRPTKKVKQKSSIRYPRPFPEIVFDMVNHTNRANPEIIEWIQDGKAFVIHDKGKSLSEVLLKYFRHARYSSFQRQLNMYGWSKKVKGDFEGAFYHPLFYRDIESLDELSKISRRAPPKRNTIGTIHNENSVNLDLPSEQKTRKRKRNRDEVAEKGTEPLACSHKEINEKNIVQPQEDTVGKKKKQKKSKKKKQKKSNKKNQKISKKKKHRSSLDKNSEVKPSSKVNFELAQDECQEKENDSVNLGKDMQLSPWSPTLDLTGENRSDAVMLSFSPSVTPKVFDPWNPDQVSSRCVTDADKDFFSPQKKHHSSHVILSNNDDQKQILSPVLSVNSPFTNLLNSETIDTPKEENNFFSWDWADLNDCNFDISRAFSPSGPHVFSLKSWI